MSLGIAKTQLTNPALGAVGSGSTIIDALYQNKFQYRASPGGATPFVSGWGVSLSGQADATSPFVATSAVTNQTAPTDTELLMTKYNSSNVAGSSVALAFQSGNVPLGLKFGLIRHIRYRMQLNDAANVRIWIGLTTTTATGGGLAVATFRTDAPVTPFIGFRYSTTAIDTTWKFFVTNDFTGPTSSGDSGVVVDTSVHTFEIIIETSDVKFLIDGVLVGTLPLTNAPPTTTIFGPSIFADNVGLANAKSFSLAYIRGVLVNL